MYIFETLKFFLIPTYKARVIMKGSLVSNLITISEANKFIFFKCNSDTNIKVEVYKKEKNEEIIDSVCLVTVEYVKYVEIEGDSEGVRNFLKTYL